MNDLDKVVGGVGGFKAFSERVARAFGEPPPAPGPGPHYQTDLFRRAWQTYRAR